MTEPHHITQPVTDGLVNLVANLGTARDKAAHTTYAAPTLTPIEACNAYRSSWLCRKIVDIPAMDACRKWRSWNAEAEQVTALEAEENRLGLQAKLLTAYKRARLYGGAALYIGTGDRDPSKELNPANIGRNGIRHLVVLNRNILTAGDIERDPESPLYGKPRVYRLSGATTQVDIHPSRLVILRGAELPDDGDLATVEAGWGDSILTAVMDEIRRADGTSANVASLVYEAKVDVLRIPQLMAMMADPTTEQHVLNRLRLAAMTKGINGMLVLDSEEDYDQKKGEFGSLRDVMLAFMQLVSGAADIPVTRLLGQSPGGLNSTGEADLRNYYDRIQSMQTLELGPAMATLDECLIRSALGVRPPEIFYTWNSLWQTTDKERADIGKTTSESIKTLSETGLIPDEVLQSVAVNMLTEAGVAPGLESEMLRWMEENPDDADEANRIAAAGGGDQEPVAEVEATDATPRTLYVRRDVVNADEIRAWAESQGIPDILDDLHVTIVYSRQPFDWIKAGNAREWGDTGRDQLVIPEGGPRAVEPLGNMAAVLMFASSQLYWRHKEIVEAGASHDFPDYTPHVSLTESPVDLSGVEPYRGRIVLGPEIFEELREG